MALSARQTQVAVGDDHAVRVDRHVIIDPRTGRAAEVENVTVAVDMGDGNIAVARQQRIKVDQAGGGYGSVSTCTNMNLSLRRPIDTYQSQVCV